MEWKKERIEEIKDYINLELAKGRPMVSIEKEDFEANERVIHKRLVRAGYKKIDNQYILSNDVIQVSNNSITKDKDKYNKSITSVIQREEEEITKDFKETDIQALKELISLVEPLKNVIQVYNKSITTEKYIDVEPIEIKIDRTKLSGNIKATGFRIDETILDYWREFIKNYNGEYKVQDLVGQALLEFIEKYKK
ncbi:hypothetical protein GNF53_14975 [Clostridium perfringens]|uniref:hypothetical protein n=1 Tax=Clostridium perfringens TaxID=1502 RepID=UPI002AC466DB|nr:hypothetical protein [Clostridium perfringens]MDZ5149282.1 hypothetical protein [Clostridium perfringens]